MSVQCEEIPGISMDMFAKVKVLRLGQIVVDLKKESEELQARAVPSTLLEHRSKIKEATAQLEELEKLGKSLVKAMTRFWMRVVQDDQLKQLGVQLHEAEAQLTTMRGSLRMMPPIVQVTKEIQLKELQQQVNKARDRHQRRMIELDHFQEDTKQLAIKHMDGLWNTRDARTKVTQVSEEHPTEQEVEE